MTPTALGFALLGMAVIALAAWDGFGRDWWRTLREDLDAEERYWDAVRDEERRRGERRY